MNMSERGQQLLMEWEGFKPKVYKDSAGLATIGVGHLLSPQELSCGCIDIGGVPVEYRAGLTQQQVCDLLAQDLARYESAVQEKVAVELEQNQFDALVSFCFNVGIGAFGKSTVLKCINEGSLADVPDELRRWTGAGGRTIQGLANRRENEIKLWMDVL